MAPGPRRPRGRRAPRRPRRPERDRRRNCSVSWLLSRSAVRWMDIVPGAQTERRGGAGPVGGLLGGKDPTGRFSLILWDGFSNRLGRTVCKTVLHKRFNPSSFLFSTVPRPPTGLLLQLRCH